MWLTINAPTSPLYGKINLPASKSISNRLLIIQALTVTHNHISNLSNADDTRILKKLLDNASPVENCGSGGTTLRFLLALRAFQGKEVVLTGDDRLIERPIGPLVNALRSLGAEIEYLGLDGYPPVKVGKGQMHGGKVVIPAGISSQFLSALMLIGPKLNGGIIIQAEGKMVSAPYIQMTADLMKEFEVNVAIDKNTITIPKQDYKGKNSSCTPDWTSASYWYGFASCMKTDFLQLKNLALDHYQGDAVLKEWMKLFNVETILEGDDVIIKSSSPFNQALNKNIISIDFSNNPDLAQTFAVIAAIHGIPINFTGLSTLRIKETDRLSALKNELEKTGVALIIDDNSLQISGKADKQKIADAEFKTYNDHRMAMALSLFCTTGVKVKIENPEVVNKSYPGFWEELKSLGFDLYFTEEKLFL